MADWSKPTLSSLYTDFLTEVKNRDDDIAKQFDGTTSSNLVTGYIRWNSSINRWQKWNGTAWAAQGSTNNVGTQIAELYKGRIVQIVSYTTTTPVTTTSTSFVTTGLSGAITPTKASSKIFIISISTHQLQGDNQVGTFTLFRGTVAGTNLGNGANGMGSIYANSAVAHRSSVTLEYVDSPNTTSSVTYTLGMRQSSTTLLYSAPNNETTSLILMEVTA